MRARGVVGAVFTAMTAVGLAVTGCQGGPAAKAGQGVVTLDFGSVATSPNADTGTSRAIDGFVAEVSSLSAGHLRITVTNDVGGGAPDSEETLIKGVEAGTYDGGWNPTRGFVSAGIRSFEALEAPFVVESYAVEQQVVTSPLAAQMLHRLDGTGLVGLGLLAGPLRRPFAAAHPLVAAGDWRGVTIRAEDTPEQRGTLAALGATPVISGSVGVDAAVHGGAGGQEFDLFQYDYDGFGNAEPYVTANLALWPKPYVLVMNAKRFGALTSQQQQWLRDAAQDAVHSSASAAFDETPAVQRLCQLGVRFADVTSDQLDGLRRAVAPVYDHLRSDPTTASDLVALQAMAAAHPGASSATIPLGCTGAAPQTATVDPTINSLPTNLPDGTYRVQNTPSDLERLGVEPGNATDNAGIATMRFERGTYALRIIFGADPNGRSEPAESGTLRGTSTILVFHPVCPAGTTCDSLPAPYSFNYTYADGRLTMTVDAGTSDPIIIGTFSSHPWLRVG